MSQFAAFDVDWTLHNSALGTDLLLAFSNAGLTTRKIDKEYKQWHASDDRAAFFKEHFMQIYDSGLVNVSRTQMIDAGKQLADEVKKRIYSELLAEIKMCRKSDKFLIAITQSPAVAALPLTEMLGFDICVAPEFEYDEAGIYTGPHHRTVDEKNKAKVLTRIVEEHGLDWTDSLAYGDSEDDLPMLELVTHPVVINPSVPLREIAIAKKWRIITTN